jgi:hypothetical protein
MLRRQNQAMAEHRSRYAKVSLVCLALFCVAQGGAMWTYAGGSWLHPHAPSHSFLENFWCDLLRDPAHNGKPNGLSSWLASLGFVAMAVALASFWLELAWLLPSGKGRFVRLAGPASAVATAAVALVPSDRFPIIHAPAVLTAGGLGFVCGCVCSAWALAQRRASPIFALSSSLLMGAAAVNLVLYVRVAYFGGANTIALPAVQKLATVALVAWMLTGLWLSVCRARPRALSSGSRTAR